MFYPNTMVGTFLSRPNRFLAHVMLDGREVVCHVKNTGRLRELLLPGVSVIVQHHPDAAASGRKTEYSLIKVAKRNVWVTSAGKFATESLDLISHLSILGPENRGLWKSKASLWM